jgi:TPP-dependent pyruvate/acetoin dehydrogenase alpha subunit
MHSALVEDLDAEIRQAWDLAMAAPWPRPEALLDRVYTQEPGRRR